MADRTRPAFTPQPLSADDRELIEADGALPGLRVVLDAAELTAALRARDPQVRAARAEYLRYKPGTAMVAGLRVLTADGERTALAQAVTRTGRPKLTKLRMHARERGTWAHVFEGLDTAVGDAAADRHLPGLPRELSRTGVHTIRYKPARRWVGRRMRSGGSELVKVFGTGQASRGARAARALAAAGVPGPHLLREARHRNTLRFTWHEGRTLADLGDPHAAQVGELLARLHQTPWPFSGANGGVPDPGNALADLAVLLPSLRPAAQAAEEIGAGLTALLGPAWDGPLVTCHGDFSADQVLAEPGMHLRLLDLDSVRHGPAESDLGEWLGEYLTRIARPGGPPGNQRADHSAAALYALAGPLLEAYRQHSSHPVHLYRVLGFAAAAVLRRAAEPFRWREPDWIATAEERARLAGWLLDQARNRTTGAA